MDWSLILNWTFVVALAHRGDPAGRADLLATLGEIITERSGVLNLGLEGVMVIGGVAGFMVAYYLQTGPLAGDQHLVGFGRRHGGGHGDGLILSRC